MGYLKRFVLPDMPAHAAVMTTASPGWASPHWRAGRRRATLTWGTSSISSLRIGQTPQLKASRRPVMGCGVESQIGHGTVAT